jgi:hypothetical protein
VIGAALMVPVSEILDATLGDRVPGIQGVVYGAALMAVMLFAPEGLYWRVRTALASRRARGAATRPPVTMPPETSVAAKAATGARGTVLMDVRAVSKSFIGLQALSDVTFDVRDGEILGIIGPNGAGKTTLFNVLNGFLVPEQGEVRFAGGLWQLGAESAATLAVFEGAGLTPERLGRFYAAGAEQGRKTSDIRSRAETIEGRPGWRIDLVNNDQLQTIVAWPTADGGRVQVALVGTAARDVGGDAAAHDKIVDEAIAAFG